MDELDELLALLQEVDTLLLDLLDVDAEKLTDENLLEIQINLEKRQAYLNQIDPRQSSNFNKQQDKEWQELAQRTQKLVELATYKKANIKESIDKREQGKRSIAAYKKLLY